MRARDRDVRWRGPPVWARKMEVCGTMLLEAELVRSGAGRADATPPY